MAKKTPLKAADVKRVADLAALPLTENEIALFLPQLSAILDFVSSLQKIDIKRVEETSQVTGLEDVFREDEIDTTRMFSQEEALANAPASYNGFFKVPKITWT